MSQFALITEFELRSLLASRVNLVRTVLIEPLAYLLLLAAGISGIVGSISMSTGSVNYFTFVYPGIVALQFLRGFTYSTYRLTIDRRWGLQALKFAAGVQPWSYIGGALVVPVAIFLVQLWVTYPFAVAFGVFHSWTALLGLMLVGIVGCTFWTSLAMAMTFFFRTYAQRDLVLNLVVLPLTFAAPVFYSMEHVPAYLRWISLCNPLTYQVEAMRSVFVEQAVFFPLAVSAALTLALLVVARITISGAEHLPSER